MGFLERVVPAGRLPRVDVHPGLHPGLHRPVPCPGWTSTPGFTAGFLARGGRFAVKQPHRGRATVLRERLTFPDRDGLPSMFVAGAARAHQTAEKVLQLPRPGCGPADNPAVKPLKLEIVIKDFLL